MLYLMTGVPWMNGRDRLLQGWITCTTFLVLSAATRSQVRNLLHLLLPHAEMKCQPS